MGANAVLCIFWNFLKKRMKESKIREILANNLNSLFPELSLIKTEYYLPKTKGTRGYIDILAKHSKGNYVIIEIKRSENSARQAIHELIKYSEGLKEKLILKDSEIELYIISTTWKELIIPFSSFKETSHNEVSGFKISLNNANDIDIETIDTIKLTGDRLFSPHQTCRHYSSLESLQIGISEHEEINYERDLNNFALVILKSPEVDKEELAEYISLMTKEAIESIGMGKSDETAPISANKLLDSKFVIYQSYIRTNKEHYLDLLKADHEYLKETLEFIEYEQYDEEAELNYLEEAALMNTGRYPKTEYAEYAYPSKFKKMTNEEGYEIIDIKLYGSLKENELIDDEIIIKEFEGRSGSEKVLFQGSAHSESKSQISEVFDKALICLENNPIWSGHITHFSTLIKNEKEPYNLFVTVFNPFNILISLFRCLKYQTNDFMPYYELRLKFNEGNKEDKIYCGIITWNEQKAPTLDEIVDANFKGEEFNVVSPLIWGGDIDNNLKVLNNLGLKYSSMLVDNRNGQILNEYLFSDFEFQKIDEENFKTIYDFVASNIDLLIDVSSLIESYSIGLNNEFIFDAKGENENLT